MHPSIDQRDEAARVLRYPYNNWDTIELEVALETMDAVRSIIQDRINKRYSDEGELK